MKYLTTTDKAGKKNLKKFIDRHYKSLEHQKLIIVEFRNDLKNKDKHALQCKISHPRGNQALL